MPIYNVDKPAMRIEMAVNGQYGRIWYWGKEGTPDETVTVHEGVYSVVHRGGTETDGHSLVDLARRAAEHWKIVGLVLIQDPGVSDESLRLFV